MKSHLSSLGEKPSGLEHSLSETTPLVAARPVRSTRPGRDAEATRFPTGTLLAGRYRILRLLGRGGMGEVYKAKDRVVGQTVALKFLPPSLERDAEHRARLFDEVRLARQVTHPNICRVHDVGESAGVPFLTMEWIDGETLAERLQNEGPLPAWRVIEIAHQVCRGLAAAHERGILHRDLKPANLMLDSHGNVRITDFGLAVVAETRDGDGLGRGTPAYMAPELFHDEPPTVRSDLYALGAALYKLLTGRPVFAAGSSSELARLVYERRPEPPSCIVADLDPDLERTVLRCLEKDPHKRPLSALEVASSLPSAALGESIQHALVLVELIGREHWPAALGATAARRLDVFHERVLRGLLKHHGGRRSTGDDAPYVFERPIHAVRFALDYQARLAELSAGETETLVMRGAIHFGEVIFDGEPEAARNSWEVASRLRSLGSRGQLLMTRQAFDLARQTAAAELIGVRWLAHGSYEIEGLPEPLELFEVGRDGLAPLRSPPDSPRARRRIVQETVDGWRPAPGLQLPRRPEWRIVEKLDEGGFGEVWTAVHPASGERRVFKFCYDARRLRGLQREITLFRLLKEELGERDDITRILDWSFEEAPYFIEVEHTGGGDLASWAEQRGGLMRIALDARLDLVAQVATALAAAHSVGVLHKDVKPANILISGEPETARARLADFGIGLATERQRLEQAGITALGLTQNTEAETASSSQEGTRLYMAPEVLAGRRATLQSDVYALGVMLYQMVAGDFSRPLGPGWERDAGDELLREDIAAAADVLPERRLSAAQLAERLRSLEERRTERAEQQRELEAGRRAQAALERWRGRRRLMVAALLVMAIFAAVVWTQARRIAREAETTERVTEFLVDLFKVSDPGIAQGEEVTAREILQRGADSIELELRDQPQIQASLMQTIGRVLFNLGAFGEAQELFGRSLEIRQRYGADPAEVAEAMTGLGEALAAKGEPGIAVETLREAVAVYRGRFERGSLAEAEALEALAAVLVLLGEHDEAEASFDASHRAKRQRLGKDHLAVAATLTAWARLPTELRDYRRAEAFLLEALRIRRALLGDQHPDVAESLYRLGVMRYMQDKYELAGEALSSALEIHRESLGSDHLTTLKNVLFIAKLYHARGDAELSDEHYRTAEESFLQVVERLDATQPTNHQWIAVALTDMAMLYRSWGDLAQSERLLERALEEYRSQEARADPDPYEALVDRLLAVVLHEQGHSDIAEPRLRAVLETLTQTWGFEHIHTATVAVELADVLISRGEHEEARNLLEEALEAYRALSGVEPWRIFRARALLAASLNGLGRPDQAQRLIDETRFEILSMRGKKRLRVEAALKIAASVKP